jgi:hypothetical protein
MEEDYDYDYEKNMNEDEKEDARMKDLIYKYELLDNKCPDLARPFAELIDNEDMTYEETLEALNDSSRKCMGRIETLNDIQAKCPILYANLLNRKKKIMDPQHFPESKITSMINGISNACNLQKEIKTVMENNPGPASLNARQRAINELENSRRPNGGRRTRKHKRSKHKRSKHKRSKHKRSKHKRSQHKRSTRRTRK